MKVRAGFVSNSSSSSFIINNISDKTKTMVEFVTENIWLLHAYNNTFGRDYTPEQILSDAELESDLYPGQNHYTFGDEDGTVIGNVFDYMLRDFNKSKNFELVSYTSRR